ncbi:MAG TPA: UDP-3-O-(3-hydroxymyristoyl)glucosamine N-acyltransferase, partial [Caulobacteraceae bacterium]
ELIAGTGAELIRGDAALPIGGVAPLVSAQADDAAFIGDRRYREALAATKAGVVFCDTASIELVPAGVAVVSTREPQALWSRTASRLHRPQELEPGAAISPQAHLEEGVIAEPGVVIGAGARIGAGTRLGANCVIGPGVQIGRGCFVGALARIGFALIGDRVRIGIGAVIGEPGFGVAGSSAGAVDVPQLGRVILQDGVSVGANTCIDRGAYDDTVIGENTKIDNLVQIGHNSRIGRSCVLAGHVGISGSVTLGDGVQMGGRAGVTDHVVVGAGARIGAAAAVSNDVPAGETWGGQPAKPMRRFLRETVWLAKQAAGRGGGAT